jgi:hypothetical protein
LRYHIPLNIVVARTCPPNASYRSPGNSDCGLQILTPGHSHFLAQFIIQ